MTSIEWLLLRINIGGVTQGNGLSIDELIEKAKEMHKQEVMNSYIDGSYTGCGCYDYMKEKDAEQYYNETFTTNVNKLTEGSVKTVFKKNITVDINNTEPPPSPKINQQQ